MTGGVLVPGVGLLVTIGGILKVVLINGGTLVMVGTADVSLAVVGNSVLGILVTDGKASLDELSELCCVAKDVETAPIACTEVVLIYIG